MVRGNKLDIGIIFFGLREGFEILYYNSQIESILKAQNEDEIKEYLYQYFQIDLEKIPLSSPNEKIFTSSAFKIGNDEIVGYGMVNYVRDSQKRDGYFASVLITKNNYIDSKWITNTLLVLHDNTYKKNINKNTLRIQNNFITHKIELNTDDIKFSRIKADSYLRNRSAAIDIHKKSIEFFFELPYKYAVLEHYHNIYGILDVKIFNEINSYDKFIHEGEKLVLVDRSNVKYSSKEYPNDTHTISKGGRIGENLHFGNRIYDFNASEILKEHIESNRLDHKDIQDELNSIKSQLKRLIHDYESLIDLVKYDPSKNHKKELPKVENKLRRSFFNLKQRDLFIITLILFIFVILIILNPLNLFN